MGLYAVDLWVMLMTILASIRTLSGEIAADDPGDRDQAGSLIFMRRSIGNLPLAIE